MTGWAILAALLTVAGLVAAVFAGGTPLAWIVLVVAAMAVWGTLGLTVLYRKLTVGYRLTTFRLFHESGLLQRARDRIEVIDIDDVTLSQGPIDRLLNVGTIHIIASDESLKQKAIDDLRSKGKQVKDVKDQVQDVKDIDGRLDMPGISDVRKVADLIDNTRRAERNRRGVYMENV
jgi:membrane protein YdbS with pleckstrin-like domain